MGCKAQPLYRLGVDGRHLAVAVNHEHMGSLRRIKVLDPVHQVVVIGVRAEAGEVDDLGPDGHVLAEELDTVGPIQQVAAQGARGLEAHEHHGAVGAPEVILQMVADTARVAHTGSGDNDLGGLVHVQQLGLVYRLGQVQTGEAEHMGAVLHQRQSVLVQIAPQIAAENRGGLLGQRAVHVHREVLDGRDQIFVLDLADKVQQLLGAAHGEGGDDHVAALAQRLVDDLRQLAGVAPHLGVIAVAVGGLGEHIVRTVEELGIADDGLIHIADIAGEHHGARFITLMAGELDAGAAQQVAGIDELRRHALHHRNVLAVFAGLDKLPHPQGIGHGVDRLHLRPSGALVLAVLVLRVLLLDMGGVLEHNVQQIGGQAGGNDLTLKAVFDEHGDAAGVVDMGVGHQHHINAAGVKGQRGVVDLVPALLQAAVHQDMLAVDLQTMAAAGNAPVSAVKTQLHGENSFSLIVPSVYHTFPRCTTAKRHD